MKSGEALLNNKQWKRDNRRRRDDRSGEVVIGGAISRKRFGFSCDSGRAISDLRRLSLSITEREREREREGENDVFGC
ncbi:unnamed protein product [Trifolium pratense]|uniref:Uncharacterized protein n=1 Tax=Trifolium pratense TaxID=57577 RepID=A0ACB0K458_TRIPR|nr:unnamed protein product [Trifolium pratense]